MEIIDIIDYLMENALILIPVLWIIGLIVKQTPKVPDWLIPWALLVFGIVGANMIIGFGIEGTIQGVLTTGFAVFGHQILKQTKMGIEDQNTKQE